MRVRGVLILIIILTNLPQAHAHMPPRDQALIIVKESDGYKFEFLVFPKKPEIGTISELVLTASYLKDGRPYTGGMMVAVEALEGDANLSQPIEILEFGGERREGKAVQYVAGGYEITAIFSANGTYAVTAWPEGERAKSARAEFKVYPRSGPNPLLFGFMGVILLVFLAVVYSFSRRRG